MQPTRLGSADPAGTKQLETYELIARPMVRDDLDLLHRLSISVAWPHRPDDWLLLMEAGRGIVACDEIGRIVGSAMWFPFGPALTSVGMVITSPRLQAHGAGRWLMDRVFLEATEPTKVLNATRAAYRLYVSMGFQPGSKVFQNQGIATAPPAVPGLARPITPEDHAAIRALDAGAIGGDRSRALDRLLALSEGTVIARGGVVTGYALCRRFGRGHVVGPIVAETPEDAVALAAPHVAARTGRFVRIDTRETEGPFSAFLAAAGIAPYDTVTSMSIGPLRPEPEGARVFGLANQALG